MLKIIFGLVVALCLLQGNSLLANSEHNNRINLSGTWKVQLSNGAKQVAWKEKAKINDVTLPGSIQAQGIGNDITDKTPWVGLAKSWRWIKNSGMGKDGIYRIPVWLQPKKHYIGKAWYQREINVPTSLDGNFFFLHLERVHIATTLWIDGQKIGTENSLSTPHRYNIGKLKAGKHKVTICVDNRMPNGIGNNAHSVSDHTQTTWNGIIGKIYMETLPDKHIKHVHLYPDVKSKKVRVRLEFVKNQIPTGAKLHFSIINPNGGRKNLEVPVEVEHLIDLGPEITLWEEFSPRLYKFQAKLSTHNLEEQIINVTFGMVDYHTEGQKFLVNGRPTYLRGTLDCASFPLSGYPSTDPEYWRKVISTCKNHGLNHIRFHSWCPPEVAFDVADELGCYLQVEHAWSNVLGNGMSIDNYLIKEGKRILDFYGNHPSFMIHSYGNEPGGKRHMNWLTKWVKKTREADQNRRIYTSACGWSVTKNSDFYDIASGLRVYPWGAGLNSSINKMPPESITDFSKKTLQDKNKPYVSHETGQWCAYPNFDEIKKYTGVMQARNFEVFKMNLKANHMGDQARDFMMASGRLQTLCYKNEIEKLLRTPGCAGYQLLGLNDFPGQGTALIGAIDVFWDTKPYTSAKEYRQFNSATVPLAKFKKFVFTKDEMPKVGVDINHHGAAKLMNAEVMWKIKNMAGEIVNMGLLARKNIPLGLSNIDPYLSLNLQVLKAPAQYKFVVEVKNTEISNEWDFWVYPEKIGKDIGTVKITRSKTEAMKLLAKGEKVLLVPSRRQLANRGHKKSVLGFSTIFWNTCWANQPPTTMGILCDPKHDAFQTFPTEYHSNNQWWYLIKRANGTINLDGQNPTLKPVVQVIDDWFFNRRLGLVVEAKCGKGKLMISSIDIAEQKKKEPVINQFRHSLLNYMNSNTFNPQMAITPDELDLIILGNNEKQTLYEVQASDQADGNEALNLIDGNPKTIWHTNWKGSVAQYPHSVTLKARKMIKTKGIRFLPRQSGNKNGLVKKIVISVSKDGKKWKQVTSALLLNKSGWQQLNFKSITARYIRIEMVAPQNPSHPWASMAEIQPVIVK